MGKKVYKNKGSIENLVISIEGATGVGKTTLFDLLKKNVGDDPKFKFFPERYRKNPPFPFGSKDKQIAFRSEFHFLQQFVKRNQNLLNYDSRYKGRIIVLDRSPICVLVYSKSLNLNEKDFSLIQDMYNSVKWKDCYTIYLTADVNTLLKRIIQRGSLEQNRKNWNESEKEYLVRILSNYNQILLSKGSKERLSVIETDNLNSEGVLKKVEDIISKLSDFSFKKVTQPSYTQMNLFSYLK